VPPPYLIEPIWEQFSALLPQRETNHPLGCHPHRIPDRVVLEKLVQVLVFGLSLPQDRRRRVLGHHAARAPRGVDRGWGDRHLAGDSARSLRPIHIGLELSEVALDCCITKAPCGGQKAGRSPVDLMAN